VNNRTIDDDATTWSIFRLRTSSSTLLMTLWVLFTRFHMLQSQMFSQFFIRQLTATSDQTLLGKCY